MQAAVYDLEKGVFFNFGDPTSLLPPLFQVGEKRSPAFLCVLVSCMDGGAKQKLSCTV